MNSNIRQNYQAMKDHSNVTKMYFWMIQRAKKEFFGHFLEFGLLVSLISLLLPPIVLLYLLFAWHQGLAGVVAFSLYVIAGVEYAEKYMVCQ